MVQDNDESYSRWCSGVVSDDLPALPDGQPSHLSPEETLAMLEQLGEKLIQSRPGFAELYKRAKDKAAFVSRVEPYMFVGIPGGLRSAFCCREDQGEGESKELCAACQKLCDILLRGR